MNLDALIALVTTERDRVLPFVGSGLTLAAGAPSAADLAGDLAHRTKVPCNPDRPSLTAVTRDAEDHHGTLLVQRHVAEIITGLRLRPTPALTAICGTPGRRVLTTNYDDGIERAARSRGLEPIILLPDDARVVDDRPDEGQLHVIHLHGIPDDPASLVLPGATTHGLDDDSVFNAFVRSVMAPRILLYLGFSLGTSESHLHRIIRWLGAKPHGAGRHHLLVDRKEVIRRTAEMEQLTTYRNVTVVPYEADALHTAVERVAVALAPLEEHELTWVYPPLLCLGQDDDEESLRRRMSGFDFEWGDRGDVSQPADLLGDDPCVIVAGPGMGKTTLLERLPTFAPNRPTGTAQLRDFRPTRCPQDAIDRLLRPLPVAVLRGRGGLMLLDGLDEVDEELEEDAVRAILAALNHWPDHTWVIASRPGRAADALSARSVVTYRMLASRRWARTYLETRSVPPDRMRRALFDGYGLGDLLAIPLFAKRLADRLLADDYADTGPLDLLVDEQYAAAEREAVRHRHATTSLIVLW